MNWDELKEKAKEMGYEFHKNGCYLQRPDSCFQFYNDGQIYVENEYESILASDYRTPDQVLMIMEALQNKKCNYGKYATIKNKLVYALRALEVISESNGNSIKEDGRFYSLKSYAETAVKEITEHQNKCLWRR